MNEQIREIWDKAAESVAAYPSGKDNSWETQVNFMDKFAQLIVAECMEVFSKDLPEPGDGKMLEVVNRVCNVAEHFGINQTKREKFDQAMQEAFANGVDLSGRETP